MKSICGCRVVGFGSKAIGFVLEVKYDEGDEVSFIIKEKIQKEVEEHLEYEEKVFYEFDKQEINDVNLEELVALADAKLGNKKQLSISAEVVHEMEVRRKY